MLSVSRNSRRANSEEDDQSAWDGRAWVDANSIHISTVGIPKLKVVQYRLHAHHKTAFMHHSVHKTWEIRSKIFLQELSSMQADILCLQDVDLFKEFWCPQLMLRGYDTVYKHRTQQKDYTYEGVLIAFKRDRFQVFKTVEVEFNNAVQDHSKGSTFKERSKTDDVGVIAFLQPINHKDIPCSLCVASVMLSESVGFSDVRAAHVQYLTQCIESANREFQLPVIIGINLNDTPGSMAYTLLRTGRIALSAQVPSRCVKVAAEPTCRGSALVKWTPPKVSIADPPIIAYHIAWRPGGSQALGYRSQIAVPAGVCVKYVEKVDKRGMARMVALEELQYVVSGLSSDVPYEFIVCATNELGEGIWSDPSDPITLPNAAKAPALPPLENFHSLPEIYELRERQNMGDLDWNVHHAYQSDPLNAQTQLTPRTLDGSINHTISRSKVLPLTVNPREGWKESLDGIPDPALTAEMNRDYVVGRSILRDKEGFIERKLNKFSGLSSSRKDPPLSTSEADHDHHQRTMIDDGSTFLLDCKEVLHHIGGPNPRQVHSLTLRSAYESYGCGGEPIFTASCPQEKNTLGMECTDYIFYSSGALLPHRLLSIPLVFDMRRGETPEAAFAIEDKRLATSAFPHVAHLFDQQFNEMYQKLFPLPIVIEEQRKRRKARQKKGYGLDEAEVLEDDRDWLSKNASALDDGFDSEELDLDVLAMEAVEDKIPTRAQVNKIKKHLKDALQKSHAVYEAKNAKRSTVFSNDPANRADQLVGRSGDQRTRDNAPQSQSSVISTTNNTDSAGKSFWGGRWTPFLRKNPNRPNYYFPNPTHASSHIAIGSELLVDESFLATLWR